MSEADYESTAVMIADWVRGGPDDSRLDRRARLTAYQRVGRWPERLGMLLTQVMFDVVPSGRSPRPDGNTLRKLVAEGGRSWEPRLFMAARVLELLQDVDVSLDGATEDVARKQATQVLREMASKSGIPGLQEADWDDYDAGPA